MKTRILLVKITFRIYSLYFPIYHTAVISNRHLSSTSTKIRSGAAAAADLQHPLEAQGEEQKRGTLGSGKNWQNWSSDSYFQELVLWTQFLYLLISRKAQKYFMVFSFILHCCSWPEVTFMRLAETCCKNMCLFACTPLSPKSPTYWLPPYRIGAVSQSYLKYHLPGYSPHIAPNKC